MASRCLSCHTDVRAQLDDPNSLHSALPDVKVCRACHAEHNGADASLTHVSLQNFPHDRLKFTLAAHQNMSNGQPFTCADCHGDNVAEFDRAKCETCHREYQADFVTKHVADFGSDCLACHDGVDRFSKFDHNRLKFTLSGEHSQIACGQCHAQVRAVADFKSASAHVRRLPPERRCPQRRLRDDCAQVPYRRTVGRTQSSITLWPRSNSWASTRRSSARKCHVNNVFKGTPQTCAACHQKDDQHQGAFGTDCAQCHNPSDWKDAKFDHNLAAFKLEGKHQTVECAQCHVNNVFKGTPQTCVGLPSEG